MPNPASEKHLKAAALQTIENDIATQRKAVAHFYKLAEQCANDAEKHELAVQIYRTEWDDLDRMQRQRFGMLNIKEASICNYIAKTN